MFKKLFKGTFYFTTAVAITAFVFPDHFTPVHKIINVGIAGGQIFYIYKYQHNKSIE